MRDSPSRAGAATASAHLVLGVYENDQLIFIGHTGGGFDAQKLKDIRARLNPLIRKTPPFKTEPKTNMPVTWVTPHTCL